jgi:neutral ceramidase
MLLAGAAQTDISPLRPMFLYGYPHVPRTSTGIHDPLMASALCLENGGVSLLLISLDILFISNESAGRCRGRLTAATGVPASCIVIGATHTHSGPVTADYLAFRCDPVVPRIDPIYLAFFEDRIVEAGTAAWRNRVEAELAAASAAVAGVGSNRLSPDGLADREAGILAIRRADTRALLALQVVYSMHPTVLHEDSTLVSADFPGFAKQAWARAFPGIVPLYFTGPSGNQSPRYSVKAQTFAEAERLGALLTEPVIGAVRRLTDADFDAHPVLRAASGQVKLEPRVFMSLNEAEANLEAKVAEYERLKREGAPHGPVRTAECTVFGAEELVVLARAQEDGELREWQARTAEVEVTALRLGNVCLACMPGEVFVEYGLAIKKHAPMKAWVVSLVNGELQGYIVTPEAEREGGYEAQCGFFTAANGVRLVTELVRLIGTLT